MGGGKKIIKKNSLEAMRVKQVNAGMRGDMGISWFIREVGGVKFMVTAARRTTAGLSLHPRTGFRARHSDQQR